MLYFLHFWIIFSASTFAQPTTDHFADFYNQGTLSYQRGEFAAAVAYLEKAHSLHPDHPDVKYNLKLAKQGLSARIGEDQLDPASTFYEQLPDYLSPKTAGMLTLTILLAVIIWFFITYFNTRSIKIMFLSEFGVLRSALFVLAFLFILLYQAGIRSPAAISLVDQTIKSGPGNQFLDVGFLVSGVKVRPNGQSSLGNQESWLQIRFKEDALGWVKESQLLLLGANSTKSKL